MTDARPSDRAIAQAYLETLPADYADISADAFPVLARARELDATAAPVVVGEDMVERAAKALCITDDCMHRDWHEFPEYGRDRYRDKARAALTAALAGD